ncbi:MAG: ABC transporter permease [Thaumarchaeota archaeon]|nr:ABC transporter permease [Nitrososphaerota archaeon]
MDYRAQIGIRFITKKKGSLIAACLAIAIAILVVSVNQVIFQGLYDAIVRDLINYRYGHVYITKKGDFISRNDFMLVNWLDRIPWVQAATPRLFTQVYSINATVDGQLVQDYNVPLTLVGVKPEWDEEASTLYQAVKGQYVSTRDSIVLGVLVDRDLGYPKIGDTVKLKVHDQYGNDVLKRFVIVGISQTAGNNGYDNGAIINIDTLREMIQRPGQTTEILVRLNDPTKANETKQLFLDAFPSNADKFKAQTITEAAEVQLAGFKSGIALINLVGLFGMVSSAFGVVTIQMMQVTSKTRDIGVLRAIGAKRKDILLVFIFQGIVIGSLGTIVGTAMAIGYTTYAKETHMTFNGSLALEVSYNWIGLIQTDIMAFALAIVASIYPAFKATRLEPVEAMRTV